MQGKRREELYEWLEWVGMWEQRTGVKFDELEINIEHSWTPMEQLSTLLAYSVFVVKKKQEHETYHFLQMETDVYVLDKGDKKEWVLSGMDFEVRMLAKEERILPFGAIQEARFESMSVHAKDVGRKGENCLLYEVYNWENMRGGVEWKLYVPENVRQTYEKWLHKLQGEMLQVCEQERMRSENDRRIREQKREMKHAKMHRELQEWVEGRVHSR